MPQIRVLPPHLRDRIAAGEVCERPGSVVKELVENSLDAGAANITVRLEGGGLRRIQVTDDGCGMDGADLEKCLERHATSKLPGEDLTDIVTMGFRGEALAAISAVSSVTIVTRTDRSGEGLCLKAEAGEILSIEPCGAPVGTTITVDSLFANTPARLKFMKRDAVEASAAEGILEHTAIAHPEVSIRALRDGKEVLHTPGDGNLLSAIYCVFGRELASNLLSLSYNYNQYHIRGYISRPQFFRGNRAMEFFSINGRITKSRIFPVALEEAYKNTNPSGKYPYCFLDISMDTSLVDVNVHPAKTEVRFLREREVFDTIYYGVKSVLAEYSAIPDFQDPELTGRKMDSEEFSQENRAEKSPEISASFSGESSGKEENASSFAYRFSQETPTAPSVASPLPESLGTEAPISPASADVPETAKDVPEVKDYFSKPAPRDIPLSPAVSALCPSEPDRKETPVPVEETSVPSSSQLTLTEEEDTYHFRCELFRTYLVAEGSEDIFIIDKHAAHERVLYQELLEHEGPASVQALLTPFVFSCARDEYAALLENQDVLEKAGFSLEDYGGHTLLVRSIPSTLMDCDLSLALSEAAAALSEGKKDHRFSVYERLLYSIACRAAVKGGDENTRAELEAICRRVLEFEDIRYCPHGRPCAWRVSRHELEKRFGR